jgi:hypothetical protein
MRTPVGKREAGARYEVVDGARYEDLAGVGECGDPTGGVRVAMVLPNLLKTHNVRVHFVQPRHDLIATLRPPPPDRRVNVELHNPQHAVGHPHTLPVPEQARLDPAGRRSGPEAADGLVR